MGGGLSDNSSYQDWHLFPLTERQPNIQPTTNWDAFGDSSTAGGQNWDKKMSLMEIQQVAGKLRCNGENAGAPPGRDG